VVTGQGQGRHFTDLPWAHKQFVEKLGIVPYPGTLNLHLADPVTRQRWIELRSGPAELIRADEPGACNAHCFHVDLNSSEAAAIVWPQIDTYPEDQIEIIAKSDLRQALGLADGTEVIIQVVPHAEALRRTVQAYLAAHNVLSLATQGPKGPWAASVFYVHVGWKLFFLSAPDSQHSHQLSLNPHVAATINPDYTNWREIRGVQLEGTAGLVTNPAELARSFKAYQRKYPFVGQQQTPTELTRALKSVRLYRIVPSRLLFVDNSRGFGHREEVNILGNKGGEAT
jgi:uncharacterized protein YhbP (UPF0306 family)